MRKKFVYFILIPFVLVCLAVYLFIDRWTTMGLEAAGEAMVGAKVEIQQLHVTLFPIGIEWRGMQAANPKDPWTNLFQTGTVRFAMDFGQLLRGKFIIETMEMNDLILGTKRTSDGSLPKKTEPPPPSDAGPQFADLAQQALQKPLDQAQQGFSLDSFRHGLNADSLLNTLDIRSVKNLDSLKQQTLASSKQWDASLNDLEGSKKQLNDIATNLKAIDPASLNGADKIMGAMNTVEASVKSLNAISQTFNARKASIEGDLQKLSTSAGAVDDLAKRDFQNLMQMAKLPNLSTTGIAQQLVGKEMYNRGLTYLSWIDLARRYAAKYKSTPSMESPPRMRGQDIHFPVERSYPKFWIKKILVSGGTDSTQSQDYIRVQGEVRNISSDQQSAGAPLTVALHGAQGKGRSLSLNALLDRTKDVPYDQYAARLENTPIAEFQLGSSGFLPGSITNTLMNSAVQVTIPGDQLDCRSRLEFHNVTVHFDGEPRNTVERMVRDVLKGISAFNVSLRIWTSGGGMDVALATNLDDQIAAGVKSAVGGEFASLQNNLKSALDARIGEKRKQFDQVLGSKRADVESQLNAVQALLTQNQGIVDAKKKELSDKLAKVKKGNVDNALKKLFK